MEVLRFFKARASAAAGHCAEVAFCKAGKSLTSGNCVEVGFHDVPCDQDTVFVRDSKDKGDGPVLAFTTEQWVNLLAEVKEEGMGWSQNASGMYVLTDADDGDTALYYTKDEWDAFVDGVSKGEFDTDKAASA